MDNELASTYKERASWVYGRLQSYFEKRDFIFLPQLNQFRRVTGPGFQCGIMSMSHYEDTSLLELHLGLRDDATEQLAFSYTNGLSGFRPNSMTLVTPIAKLYDQPFQRFSIQRSSDADAVLATLVQQLNDRGLIFLNRYSQTEDLEQLFNADPETPLPLLHNQVHRCIRGLALAKLMSRHYFESLAERYLHCLYQLAAPEKTIQSYKRLWNFLRTYSLN